MTGLCTDREEVCAANAKGTSRAALSRRTPKSRQGGGVAALLGLAVALSLTSTGCGGDLTSAELARVTEETRSGIRVARRVATVLDFLHLLPKEACGEPERHFAPKIVPDFEKAFGCTLLAKTGEETADTVRLELPNEGCTFHGRQLQGALLVSFNGGEDRKDLVLDFNELLIDGRIIPARGGYGECGDAQSFWADAAGTLPQSEDRRYVAGGKFKQLEGIPLIGGEQASLDASGLMTTADGTGKLRVKGLVLMLFKKPIPRRGELEIELEDGRFISAKVQNESLDEELIDVEVKLDDRAPVQLQLALQAL